LQTPRGTGTSGHIEKNLSILQPRQNYNRKQYDSNRPPPKPRVIDPAIADHEKKRQIEVKVVEFRELMEEEEFDEKDILREESKFRQLLLSGKDTSDCFRVLKKYKNSKSIAANDIFETTRADGSKKRAKRDGMDVETRDAKLRDALGLEKRDDEEKDAKKKKVSFNSLSDYASDDE